MTDYNKGRRDAFKEFNSELNALIGKEFEKGLVNPMERDMSRLKTLEEISDRLFGFYLKTLDEKEN